MSNVVHLAKCGGICLRRAEIFVELKRKDLYLMLFCVEVSV